MKQTGSVLTDAKTFQSFSVDNLDKAKAFYHDTLGLSVNEMEMGLELDVRGNKVFVYPKPNHTPATYTVLNFEVDDVSDAVDQLKSAGVRFENYNLPDLKTDSRGIANDGDGHEMAWFKDPAGNILSVIHKVTEIGVRPDSKRTGV